MSIGSSMLGLKVGGGRGGRVVVQKAMGSSMRGVVVIGTSKVVV